MVPFESRVAGWSPDGAFLCLMHQGPEVPKALQGGTVRLYEASRMLKCVMEMDFESAVLSAAWHPSGSALLVCCARETLLVDFAHAWRDKSMEPWNTHVC